MMILELFFSFFKIGLFTFGGGYAMLPLIQAEVVQRGWLSSADIVNFIAVSESTPGPFAVNIATYVGTVTAGIGGAACATLGVVLPSLLVMLAVARFYDRFRTSRLVAGAMSGLRPAVVGLIASALVSLGRGVFFPDGWALTPALGASAAIFGLTAYLAFRKKPPILLIGLSAALGVAAGFALGL